MGKKQKIAIQDIGTQNVVQGRVKIEDLMDTEVIDWYPFETKRAYKISMSQVIEEGYPKNRVQGRIPIDNLIAEIRYLMNPKKRVNGRINITSLIPETTPIKKIPQLKCDNPNCRVLIEGDPIIFSRKYNESYHSLNCGDYATALKEVKSFKSGGDGGVMIFPNIEYISRKEALELKRLEKKAK
jgi:hypothetical protein